MTVAAGKLKPTVLLDAEARRSMNLVVPVMHQERARRHATSSRRHRWVLMRSRGMAATRFGWRVAMLVGIALVLSGCASKRVMVAPRVDLTDQGTVGLVTFTIENAKGDLNELATERFMAEVFAGQEGVAILELGQAEAVLADIGEQELHGRAVQRIGEAWDVPAVFVGHLKVSDVKPRGVLAGLSVPRMEASVTVDLSVRLLSTTTGATIWSSRATASETVGELGLVGGDVYFSAENPNEAYGRLVDYLVFETTRDLRPSWVKP